MRRNRCPGPEYSEPGLPYIHQKSMSSRFPKPQAVCPHGQFLRQKPQRFKFIVEAVKLPAENFFVVLLFHVSDHTAAGGHCASQRRWDAAVTCAQLAVILNGLLGQTLSSLDDLQLGMPIFDDNRDAQV